MSNHWYYGRKDKFIQAALATGKYDPIPQGAVMNLDVRGTGKKSLLRTRIDHRGYTVIHLFDGLRRQPVLLHRLIALKFVNRPDGATQVNHKNGNKQDCAASNLEWMTGTENCRHAYATGLHSPTVLDSIKFQAGEAHHAAKLAAISVAEIRKRLAGKESQGALALAYGVSQSVISRIATGKNWKHLPEATA